MALSIILFYGIAVNGSLIYQINRSNQVHTIIFRIFLKVCLFLDFKINTDMINDRTELNLGLHIYKMFTF